MRADLCDGCRNPILTDHPLNLCPDCDLRLQTRLAKERAWKQTPLQNRILIRLLEVSAGVFGIIFGSLALWVLEPAFHRLMNHLWPLLTLVGTLSACYFSYEKAQKWKNKITASEPVVTWYKRRS
jgi:hypothetical protein